MPQIDGNTVGSGENDNWTRTVLDALPSAIYATDAAGRITYYNEAAVRLAGRWPELGKDEWCITWRLYWPDGTPMPHDKCPMAIALKEDRPVRGMEAILERPDGTRASFLPYPTPLHDVSGTLVGAVNLLIDISDRKAADDARAYLAAIVDSSDDAIISKNLKGVITSWNRGAENIFGYRAEEVIGRSITIIIPPDRMAEEEMILSRLIRGEQIVNFETVRRHKGGHEIDVSLTISPVRDGTGRIIGASKIARNIMEKKRTEAALHELNDTLEQRVAQRTRELSEANNVLMAERAERDRTEATLRQAQKMEAVGQLASGIAHDFNNLLGVVLGNLELIERYVADGRVTKLVQRGKRAVRRGALLNHQLLAFSRKQPLAPRSVDLNSLVIAVEDMLHRTLGGTVEVSTVPTPTAWPALVDRNQLELVILNLGINARDAMPLGGTLRIETRNIKAGELDTSLGLKPGDYVSIAVVDSGCGMTEGVLARACEPFFTTKAVGKGTGLGLAQVYGLVKQSGGGMQIQSAPGKGTKVEIFLPRSFVQVEDAIELRAGAALHPARRQATGTCCRR